MLPLMLATLVASGEPARTRAVPLEITNSAEAQDQVQLPDRPVPRPASTVTGVPPQRQAPHLLGDWGGIRTALETKGITPAIDYIAMPAVNIAGGSSRRADYAAQVNLGLSLDLERIAGLRGGAIQGLVIERHGANLTDVAGLGLLQNPQAIFGAGRISRLSQLFYRQRLGKVEAKLGRVSVGEDFAAAPCFFQSLYFCGPIPGHVAPAYWYNPPVSIWGARVKVEDAHGYTQVGVYERNPVNRDVDHGFYLGTGGRTGVLLPVERAFVMHLGGDERRPGTYKLGIWYDTSRADHLVRDAEGGFASLTGEPLASVRGRWGAYFTARQQLTAAAPYGSGAVSVFASGVLADRRTNPLRSKIIAGITWSGLINGRPKDEIGLAVGRTRINPNTTALQGALRDLGQATLSQQRDEWAAELTYSVVVHPAVSLRPNIQLYVNPGGRADGDPIAVLGLGAFISL